MKKNIIITFLIVFILFNTKVYAEDDHCAYVIGGGAKLIEYITNTTETIDEDLVCNTCADASHYELRLPTSNGQAFDGWYSKDGNKIEELSDLQDIDADESIECAAGKPLKKYK